ncbi:L-serine ammonia-lyase, iron-sulfur-dependent subunit beta [Candidatus Harpocratesius sp.]
MKYDSIFDVVGHIMVGPSSSHTAGACRIAYIAHLLFSGIPKKAEIYLHGSFAETYLGHKSDVAIIGGLIGYQPDDERIPFSVKTASELNLEYSFITTDLGADYHPNTIKIQLHSEKKSLVVIGSSIGGGNIIIKEIDGMDAGFMADNPTIIEIHQDKPGIIAKITDVIAKLGLNVTEMHLSRDIRKNKALSWLEFQEPVPFALKEQLEKLSAISEVIILNV